MSSLTIPRGARVLVTGASGFTGQLLTKKLVSQRAQVRAIARHSSNLSAFSEDPIDWVRGDVYDPQVIQQAVQGIEYIFHVAAAYREPQITDKTYELVHVTSTQLLAKAVLGRPEFKRFVHISTVGVHGHIDEPPADESYRFSPGDVYQRTKADAERWITEFGREHGLPFTIIRPAAIYGPGDRRLLKVFRLAKNPFFPLFGRGRGFYHLIHVEDLTNIFIHAAMHPRAHGEAFIAGNPAPSQLREIARIVADEIGNTRLKFVRLPVWPLFLAADLCEAICKPLKVSPPIYRRRVAFFTKDRAFNTAKLQQLLEYTTTIDVESGLRGTARWYKEHGWL